MSKKGENITKRKDGRWEARLICGYTPEGVASYRYFYGKTYGEAKAKKEFARSRICLLSPGTSGNLLTVEHLAAEFLLHKKATVKPSTFAHYENLIQNHIRTPLGALKLSRITASLVEEYTQTLLSSGKGRGQGLSPKSVKDILCLLRGMMDYGVSKGYLSPAQTRFSSPKVPKKETQVFGKEELEILESFALTPGDPCKFGVYLCLYSGLRIGEICSLRWEDVDFTQSLLWVRRTIQRIPSNGRKKTQILITEPKTATSFRAIPIPFFLLQQLADLRGDATGETYLLTGTEKYIEPSNYYMKYRRWLRRLQLPHRPFHALRHTFATRCIENGFDPKSLSEILGHADVKITLNRYVHPTLELKRSHMERLLPYPGPRRQAM